MLELLVELPGGVAAGADLVVTGGTFNGTVIVADEGYLDTTRTSIAGRVTLVHAYGAALASSKIPGGLATRAGSGDAADGFVSVTGSLLGKVVAWSGATEIEDSQVAGNLTATGGAYTDLYGSFVDGRVQVTDNSQGAAVCGTAVHGPATYTGNQTGVQLGRVQLGRVQLGGDGPLVTCDTGNSFGQDVQLSDTTGGVFLADDIVAGDLAFSGNDPAAQLGASVLVGGQVVQDEQQVQFQRNADVFTAEQGRWRRKSRLVDILDRVLERGVGPSEQQALACLRPPRRAARQAARTRARRADPVAW